MMFLNGSSSLVISKFPIAIGRFKYAVHYHSSKHIVFEEQRHLKLLFLYVALVLALFI